MSIQSLYDFIDRAETNRKYLPNVATNFRTPLRLIEKELTEEERSSVDLIKKNLDQIINLIYSKNGNKLSASSLEVYRKRIKSLIADYENYGKDPSAMANWSRPITTRTHRENKVKSVDRNNGVAASIINNDIPNVSTENESSIVKHEEMLTHGKAFIFTPKKLEVSDLGILQAYLNYLKIRMNPNENNSKNEESSSRSDDSSRE